MILVAFFACIYLHFRTSESVEQSDVIATQQSAIKHLRPQRTVSVDEKMIPADALMEEKVALSSPTEDFITDEDLAQVESDDEMTALPWDDIDEGWKNQLKEYLVSIDPEKGEEMFSAYLEEKKKYVERVDFTDAESGVSEDMNAPDLVVEQDSKEGELERIHVQNLKDIFGDHFNQVEALHKEYVESIQYLNRSSQKFSVTL